MTALPSAPPRRSLSREDYERLSPVVRRQAMWFARRAPAHVKVADLAAKGWAGALDALVSMSAMTDGSEPEAYVLHRIRTAMFDYLLSLDAQSKELRKRSRLIARTIGLLARMYERPPTAEEIVAGLSWSYPQYEQTLVALHDLGLCRIEVLDFDEGSSIRPSVSFEERTTLEHAIGFLPEEGKQLLALVYQEDCSLADAAQVLQVEERDATRIFAETIHRLRAALGRE